ncbi:galactosylceramide sulfotransferase-like [Dreissena polymorpha]|uniref:galactosylceramide sulfotransferase-like n=1 Tax=Dreissena polymorpha TaxID=45954 RepID=UPI00226421B5|nr:galactosylceramide sulfotransferase-like [Dreissena polymorpha]
MRIHLLKRNIKLVILIAAICVTMCYLFGIYGLKPQNSQLSDYEVVPMYGGHRENNEKPSPFDDYDDPFSSSLVTDLKVYNKVKGKKCLEQRDFVFIKTMKCATQTMVQIFRRFGYRRHLNFVLPRGGNIYLGWPYIPELQDYRPSKRPFNALAEHSVYNETVMKSIMPKTTHYVTIIREPFSQFKSSFHYFNVANISRMKKTKDDISEYLHHLDTYETFYKTPAASATRYCIPDEFSVTKNLLSHCLGMPLGFPAGRENITSQSGKIAEYIEMLDRNFMLVMIMEYFHESLVLLKRLMCWSMEDIMYHTVNVGQYSYKDKTPDPENLKIYKHWSGVDFLLYNHFNQSFWKKVKHQGDDFFDEVKTFNDIHTRVSKYCSNLEEGENSMMIMATAFSDQFVVTKEYCVMLGVDLLTFLKTRMEREEGWVNQDTGNKGPKRGC